MITILAAIKIYEQYKAFKVNFGYYKKKLLKNSPYPRSIIFLNRQKINLIFHFSFKTPKCHKLTRNKKINFINTNKNKYCK